MTRGDIAREIDFVDFVMQSHFNDYGEETHRILQEAIKIIKQEPVLDKIKKEIEQLPNANPSYSYCVDVVDREDVFEIIDKYKEEREE